jgi:hypothetical protein
MKDRNYLLYRTRQHRAFELAAIRLWLWVYIRLTDQSVGSRGHGAGRCSPVLQAHRGCDEISRIDLHHTRHLVRVG